MAVVCPSQHLDLSQRTSQGRLSASWFTPWISRKRHTHRRERRGEALCGTATTDHSKLITPVVESMAILKALLVTTILNSIHPLLVPSACDPYGFPVPLYLSSLSNPFLHPLYGSVLCMDRLLSCLAVPLSMLSNHVYSTDTSTPSIACIPHSLSPRIIHIDLLDDLHQTTGNLYILLRRTLAMRKRPKYKVSINTGQDGHQDNSGGRTSS